MRTISRFVIALCAYPALALHAQELSADKLADRMAHELVRIARGTDTSARFTIDQEMARLHVTGASVAVVAHGKVVWARGFGVKEFGKSDKVDSTTLFLAGSISKPVFATGALLLVESGKVSLDANINTILKSWRLPLNKFNEHEYVTLRRLLSHSAGLTVHGFPGYDVDSAVPTIPQILDGARPANTPAVRNDTFPGARWNYSGGGITIAQLAITDATGESFPALLKRLVLTPAGMSRSTYENPLPTSRAGEAASAHEKPDTVVHGRWHVYPEMAAAGLWTTASDLGRWGIAIMKSYRGEKGAILSTAMAREMLRPQIIQPKPIVAVNVPNTWWGLGVDLEGSGSKFNFSHGGRDEGFIASSIFYPELDVGLVVMTNATNGQFLNEVGNAFTRAFVR